jgi:hypothetical protein
VDGENQDEAKFLKKTHPHSSLTGTLNRLACLEIRIAFSLERIDQQCQRQEPKGIPLRLLLPLLQQKVRLTMMPFLVLHATIHSSLRPHPPPRMFTITHSTGQKCDHKFDLAKHSSQVG